MPDADFMIRLTLAGVSAGASAAVVLLLCAWPWRAPHPKRLALGWVLGIGAGFYAGCAVLGFWPKWPLQVVQDRLLAVRECRRCLLVRLEHLMKPEDLARYSAYFYKMIQEGFEAKNLDKAMRLFTERAPEKIVSHGEKMAALQENAK